MIFLKTFLILITSLTFAADIKIGYIEFSPFIYKNEKGKLIGSIPTYAKKIFPAKNIQWKHIPLKRVTRSLNEDQIDVFVSFYKSAEREEIIEYHNRPYYELRPTVCSLKGVLPPKITSFSIFSNKRVLTVLGTLVSKKFPASTEFTNIKINEYRERSISLLQSKRVEYAYFGDDQTVQQYLNNREIKNITCKHLPTPPLPIYMVTKKGSPLRFHIDARINKIGRMTIP